MNIGLNLDLVEYQNSIQTSKWTRVSAKSNHSWAEERKYVRDACATTNILPFAFDGVTNLNGHIPTLPREGEDARDRKIAPRTCSHSVLFLSPSLPTSLSLSLSPVNYAIPNIDYLPEAEAVSTRRAYDDWSDDNWISWIKSWPGKSVFGTSNDVYIFATYKIPIISSERAASIRDLYISKPRNLIVKSWVTFSSANSGLWKYFLPTRGLTYWLSLKKEKI